MSDLPLLLDNGQQLPNGWELTTLGKLANYINGRAFKPTDWETTGRPIIRIQNLTGSTDTVNRFSGEVEPKYIISDGDLLISWSATLGAFIYRGEEAVLNQHIFKVEPFVNKKFLFYLVNAYLDTLKRQVHGSGMQHITKGKFDNSPVPLPPPDEQKRIAEKLDQVLARVDACQTHLERVPQILKRFRQSVLAAATLGQLTEGWREEKAVIGNWKLVNLREVAIGFNYGTSAKSQKEGKVPVLRMGNIQDGKLDWSDLVFTSSKDEIEKYKLVKGDVLFNRTNSPDLVGKTAVYKGERPAIYAGYLIKIKCGDELLPDFINYCLNSPMGRDWRWQVKSDGVSQSNINAQKLADFEFELPPLEEQAEIVRRVEKLFAYAAKLEARYQSASEQVARLTPSLLAKAFRGELVGQDPNDEPASALVGRIRETRDAQKADPSVKSKKSKRS